MKLKKYFQDNSGSGTLATCDKSGRVNLAVYSSPHVEGKDLVSFIMKNRLSRSNLKSNPRAAYMFTVAGTKSKGVRLYLKMIDEDSDQDMVAAMRKRKKPLKKGDKLYFVHFKVTKAIALVGDREYVLN